MLSEGTISATGVWKRFRADRQRMLLRDQLDRTVDRIRRSSPAGWRWVLRDLDVHAEPGESVGLIGANGSGKSTLLKILTRVMYPTAGRVEARGRVGALIEVKAGIHPDLTGRENTFLCGSLMGLRRKEVARRFDEIVEFAELADAIDRQVKFYSSGMSMRLGFAVAAFLEPDILLVDEVLAVGDAAFQQRCLDRMGQVLGQGTTLVFVSHDLAAVEATCARGVWLDQGVMRAVGPIGEVLAGYRGAVEQMAENAARGGPVALLKAAVEGAEGKTVRTEEGFVADITLRSDDAWNAQMYLGVSEGTASPIFVVSNRLDLTAGDTDVRCELPSLPLPRGRFFLWATVLTGDRTGQELLAWQPVAHFDVVGPDLDAAPLAVVRHAPFFVPATWSAERL